MSKAAELAALIGGQKALGNKNFIINGDFQVWQRATAATAAVNGVYNTVDRFAFGENTDGAYTSEQSTDTPTGTGNSLKLQVTTADTSLSAAQYAYVYHPIEAQNLQSLQYGTSSAKSLTLSFWVKSNKTGIYTASLYKQDSTAYHFTQEYTISSANTWEKKIITITPTAGSTSFITSSGGAIPNDNGAGIYVNFNLDWGSDFTGGTSGSWSSNASHYTTTNAVNWMDSTSNNFYLAQVQLEIGEVATAFENEDYGTTLAKCQRYYTKESAGTGGLYKRLAIGQCQTSTTAGFIMSLSTPLRATPTLETSGNANHYQTYSAGAVDTLTAITQTADSDDGTYNHNVQFTATVSSGLVAGDATELVTNNNASYYLAFDAEL